MKKISLHDKEVFEKAYSSLNQPLSDLSFNMMVLWDNHLDIKWREINSNLCVFSVFEDSLALWGPPLPGTNLKETLDECFKIMEEYNTKNNHKGTPAIYYIPEDKKKEFEIEGFETLHQNQDYVYLTEHIISMPGKSYKNKRNLKNKLIKNNNVKIEEYNEKHQDQCLDLLNRWKEFKKNKLNTKNLEKMYAESKTNEFILKNYKNLSLKGIVVFVDDKIEGFTFGEELTKDMMSVTIEKTNLEIAGLPQYIYSEFIKNHWKGYKYVNAGEDWDVDYLKETKKRYKPVKELKSYMVVKK